MIFRLLILMSTAFSLFFVPASQSYAQPFYYKLGEDASKALGMAQITRGGLLVFVQKEDSMYSGNYYLYPREEGGFELRELTDYGDVVASLTPDQRVIFNDAYFNLHPSITRFKPDNYKSNLKLYADGSDVEAPKAGEIIGPVNKRNKPVFHMRVRAPKKSLGWMYESLSGYMTPASADHPPINGSVWVSRASDGGLILQQANGKKWKPYATVTRDRECTLADHPGVLHHWDCAEGFGDRLPGMFPSGFSALPSIRTSSQEYGFVTLHCDGTHSAALCNIPPVICTYGSSTSE